MSLQWVIFPDYGLCFTFLLVFSTFGIKLFLAAPPIHSCD